MIRGLAALALAAAGCFSIPPFEPEGGVSYTAAGTGAIVAAPGFKLRFADGPGFHFPDSLEIDGDEVIGSEPETVGCFAEDGIGLRLKPALRISARGSTVPVTNVLAPVLSGPAVVQVKLEWSSGFPSLSCGADRDLGGTSMFTVFPDGRIVRHDEISYPGSSIPASLCECGPDSSPFIITTYWTLARGRFGTFYDSRSEPPEANPLPAPMDGTGENSDSSCVDDRAGRYQIAFAWPEPMGTAIRGGNDVIVFGRDLGASAPNIDKVSKTNSSVLVIERTNCLDAIVRAREHAYPSTATLKVNGEEKEWMTEARDGIYGGDNGITGPGIDLDQDEAVLTGTVRSPFAVWLRFPRSVDALRATRGNSTGSWYIPQQVDDRSWIVWFRDPLGDTETITIKPR